MKIYQIVKTENEKNEMDEQNQVENEIDDKGINNNKIQSQSNSQEIDRLIEDKSENHKDLSEYQSKNINDSENKTQSKGKK